MIEVGPIYILLPDVREMEFCVQLLIYTEKNKAI